MAKTITGGTWVSKFITGGTRMPTIMGGSMKVAQDHFQQLAECTRSSLGKHQGYSRSSLVEQGCQNHC